MHLNPSQMRAVRHEKGPCLVLAGPGSGKTTVISCRIRELIHEKHVPPESILVITFTRAAAAEMKQRFLKMEEEEGTQVVFGTFHSVFFRILRTHTDLQANALVSEGRKRRILQEVLEGQCDAGSLLAEISYVKNTLTDPGQYVSKIPQIDFPRICAAYERKMQAAGLLDYDDILVRTHRLFAEQPDVLQEYRERFRHVLIDEFQDVNPLQYAIVRQLAGPEDDLFAVGDDDQAIYRFRGADPGIMLNFRKDYPKAELVTLDRNYRSGPVIVKAAARLISRNQSRYRKELKAAEGSGKPRGSVEKRLFRSETEEAAEICAIIEKSRENGRKYGDHAVLVRTGASADTILQAFVRNRIPFSFRERLPNLFRHDVLKPVYAYLNWTAGDRSRGNFLRFMNCPVRYLKRSDLTEETVDLGALRERFASVPGREYLADRIGFLQYQLDFLQRMRTPYAMVNYVRKAVGYDAWLQEQAAEDGTDASDRLALLDEVQASALSYGTVQEWYGHIVRYTKELERKEREERRPDGDCVTVSTFHGAKGLEFRTVLIPDVNEHVIPHEKALSAEDLEEERRMFYVAVTRAAEELYLFSVRERFGKPLDASRFLKELG